MSPEAWGFFSVLVTTQGKQMLDLMAVRREQRKDPDKLARIERKIDRLSAKVTLHSQDPNAHELARRRLR